MRWVGVPYARMNCLELALAWTLETRGIEIPNPGVSREQPTPPEEWWRHWVAVDPNDLAVGDVLEVGGNPRGVGVVQRDRRVLTTTPETGSVLAPLDVFLANGLIGAWRPAAAQR